MKDEIFNTHNSCKLFERSVRTIPTTVAVVGKARKDCSYSQTFDYDKLRIFQQLFINSYVINIKNIVTFISKSRITTSKQTNIKVG